MFVLFITPMEQTQCSLARNYDDGL